MNLSKKPSYSSILNFDLKFSQAVSSNRAISILQNFHTSVDRKFE
jgi:hypothetical protein